MQISQFCEGPITKLINDFSIFLCINLNIFLKLRYIKYFGWLKALWFTLSNTDCHMWCILICVMSLSHIANWTKLQKCLRTSSHVFVFVELVTKPWLFHTKVLHGVVLGFFVCFLKICTLWPFYINHDKPNYLIGQTLEGDLIFLNKVQFLLIFSIQRNTHINLLILFNQNFRGLSISIFLVHNKSSNIYS